MKSRALFLALICVQALHSLEEYFFRLYDVFPPARLVSGLVSDDREQGFVIANVLLVGFGFWCYAWPVRQSWAIGASLAWLWVCIELINGVGHPAWSILQGHYTPGMVTAVPLLVLAISLARRLRAENGEK